MFSAIYLGNILITEVFQGEIQIQYGESGPPRLKLIININNEYGLINT